MNNIKESLNKILPTESEKKIILNNILNQKNKKKFKFNYNYLYAPVFTVFIVFVFVIGNSSEPISNKISRTINIRYDNKSYCEDGIYNDDVNDLEKLDGVLQGGVVYKTSDGNLVIYEEETYKKYVECEGD